MSENRKNKTFVRAVKSNDWLVVEKLLPDIEPDFNDNWTLVYICTKGYVECLRVVLLDARIDPTINDNQCFFMAILSGRLDIIKLLITEPIVGDKHYVRVNPSSNDNFALMTALHHNKNEIVKFLLADDRVIEQLRISKSPINEVVRSKSLEFLQVEDGEFDDWEFVERLTPPTSYFYSFVSYFYG